MRSVRVSTGEGVVDGGVRILTDSFHGIGHGEKSHGGVARAAVSVSVSVVRGKKCRLRCKES